MWFEDAFYIFQWTFTDIWLIINRYPILFAGFILSLVLGLVLFFLRWFYRADF